ncbi:MAG: purine-nucleoside phosphorylase [Bacteroidota bacterium]
MKPQDDSALPASIPHGLLESLRDFTGGPVDVAVVLGSGLGGFASTIEILSSVSTRELPGYPVSTIIGHEGRLLLGSVYGLRLLLFQGRVHGYEGYSTEAAALPAQISAALGARLLLLTNAAGGLHPAFRAGDLMMISDLLVLPAARRMGYELNAIPSRQTPLPRPLFDANLLELLRQSAADSSVALREGTYGFCSGPTYETRSEISFFRMAGADAAGMSTAPEVIAAARASLPVLAISCITNIASTVRQKVTHDEVTTVASQASDKLARLVHALLQRM